MLGYFDKELFAELLKKAIGARTAYRYSQEVDVSRGHISLLLRKESEWPPTANTIKKLSSKADNNITYEQLMIAAGHLESENKNIHSIHIETPKGQNFNEIAPPELAKEFNELGYELISLMKDSEMTVDELKELLVMLRALKSKRKGNK